MKKDSVNSIPFLLPLQFFSFLFLLLMIITNSIHPIAIFSLVFIEVYLIYLQIIRKKDVILYLWQLQFAILITISIIQNPRVFFNAYKLPISLIVLSIALLIIIELIFLLLFIYKEKIIGKLLKGMTLSTIGIVLLIIILISSEGIQVYSDIGVENFLFSSDWRPNPAVTQSSNIQLQPNTNNALEIISIKNIYSIEQNKIFNMSFTIQNNQDFLDISMLEIKSSTGLIINNLTKYEFSIESHGSVSVPLSIISTEYGEKTINISCASINTNTIFYKEISIISMKNPCNLYFDQKKIVLNQDNSAQKSIFFKVENPGNVNLSLELTILATSNFRPSISGTQWNYSVSKGTLTVDPDSNVTLELNLLMVTFDAGNYTMEINAIDRNSGLPLDSEIISITYAHSELLKVSNCNVYIGDSKNGTIHLTLLGRNNDNISLEVASPNYLAYYFDGNKKIILSNGAVLVSTPLGNRVINVTFSAIGEIDQSTPITIIAELDPGTTGYGILPSIYGTIITTILALLIAIPLSLGTAIYLAKYCPKKIKIPIKSALELIAGIPSVIIGLWAFYTFGPLLVNTLYPFITGTLGQIFPFLYTNNITYRCLMSSGIILGIMIYPIITILAEDAISSVDEDLVQASMGLGATKWQSIKNVVLVKSKSGIYSAVLLGTGRAIGETMAVLMVMGATMAIPSTLFGGGATMTSVIAGNFTTISDLDIPRHALLGIATLLFAMILCLNIILLIINKNKNNGKSIIKKSKREWPYLIRIGISEIIKIFKRNKKSTFQDTKVQILKEKAIIFSMISAIIIGILVLIYILSFIIINGGSSIQLDFFFQSEAKAGKEGGFLNAILGSISLISVALIFAIPFSFCSSIYVVEYSQTNSKLSRVITISINMLSSTPSIVFGAFGFLLFVIYFKFGFSLLAGGLTLGIMILPILITATIEALKSVPNEVRNGSYALGVSKWNTISKSILPTAMPAITSGLILSMSRAIGEAAAVLITAGYAQSVMSSVLDPTASLPNMIYQYYEISAKYPTVAQKVYSAALVLIIIVLVLNISAKVITAVYRRRTYGK
jgi:phosphate transport system permease protein